MFDFLERNSYRQVCQSHTFHKACFWSIVLSNMRGALRHAGALGALTWSLLTSTVSGYQGLPCPIPGFVDNSSY